MVRLTTVNLADNREIPGDGTFSHTSLIPVNLLDTPDSEWQGGQGVYYDMDNTIDNSMDALDDQSMSQSSVYTPGGTRVQSTDIRVYVTELGKCNDMPRETLVDQIRKSDSR